MHIPRELIEHDQWIFWKQEIREGKATKVPCTITGRPASVTDPGAWNSYEDAAGLLLEMGEEGGIAGLGFCFTPDDPFVGVDLDGCFPYMRFAAKEILAHLPTYAEISPSGTGIKIFAEGDISGYTRSRTSEVPGFKQLEVYSAGRFFTVTGERIGSYPDVNNCQEGLLWLMETYLPNPQAATPQGQQRRGTGAATQEDQEILDLMFGFANGEKARRLFNGDTSDYSDDHSTADLALVSHLAFVVGDDPERIDHLFRSSALMRDKWDKRRGSSTYGARTIAKVLAEATDFYTPPGTPDAELSAWADSLGGDGWHAGTALTDLAGSDGAYTAPSGDGNPDSASEGSGETETPPVDRPVAAASFPIPEHGLIRDVVDLFQGKTEVPDETLALCMLATMSAVTGWHRWIKWGESEEPAILYAMIIGKSASSKKSTGMRTVSALWHDAGVHVGLTSQHASGRALVEAAMGGVEIFQAKPTKVPLLATPEEVAAIEFENLRLEADKTSKLTNPPPIVLEWDEFGTMLNVQGRWQEDTRVQLLQMYNGRHSGIRTTGKGGITVPGGKTSMSLIGTMTMDDLCRSLNMGQVGDGLIGRILFSPPGPDKPAIPRPRNDDLGYAEAREAVVEKIKAYANRVSTRSYSAYDGWTDEANFVYDNWYMAQHKRTADLDLERAMFGRGATIVVKVAALLAGAEDSGWDDDGAGITIVQEHHIEQAIAIVEASWKVAMQAINFQMLSQRDRWCDAAVELLRLTGPMSQWDLTRRALVPKEPGDRTIEQHVRAEWLAKDPRMVLDKTNNRGYVVKLK